MVRGVGLNDPKLEKYLFPGISGCIFAPGTGGPGESSCPEGSEYVWHGGVGSQKCLVMGSTLQYNISLLSGL